MGRLDALFLHVPRIRGERREIMVLPLGVPALANLLADEGRAVELWHLGVESEVAGGFSLRRALAEREPALVLLSLHWNQQTRPVLDLAERLRRWLPSAKLVLGGLTASVFARELARLPFVDAVVRGDGEEPLRALARLWLDHEGSLEQVPNLVFRSDDGAVRESERRWALAGVEAAGLRHGDLSLLRHREAYLARARYADFSVGSGWEEGYARAAYLNGGRGCTASCACCGGAAAGQRLTSRRRGLVLYPREKLLRDLDEARADGARVLRCSFDPPRARRHLLDWFAGARAAGHSLRLVYDLWALPSRALLEALARTFEPGSVVVFSPECGSEQVRRLIRPPGLTNEALLEALSAASGAGLRVHCFFSAGLPGERPADVDETARLIEAIRRLVPEAAISVTPMYVDPASPLSLAPERYGVRLLRRSLADYYEEAGVPGGPGYETEHFDEPAILAACDRLLAIAGGAGSPCRTGRES